MPLISDVRLVVAAKVDAASHPSHIGIPGVHRQETGVARDVQRSFGGPLCQRVLVDGDAVQQGIHLQLKNQDPVKVGYTHTKNTRTPCKNM